MLYIVTFMFRFSVFTSLYKLLYKLKVSSVREKSHENVRMMHHVLRSLLFIIEFLYVLYNFKSRLFYIPIISLKHLISTFEVILFYEEIIIKKDF